MLNGRLTVNDEFERIWKEMVTVYLEDLPKIFFLKEMQMKIRLSVYFN